MSIRDKAAFLVPDLLNWMAEAAEVVDLMNQQHQLQHLDIKPRNLFLIANHLKLADFGLLSSMKDLRQGNDCRQRLATLTPRYAAPETFDGTFTEFSDQYSLAITYHELLTGTLPFRGTNFQQLAMQHARRGTSPGCSQPQAERPVVASGTGQETQGAFSVVYRFRPGPASDSRPPRC